MGLMGFLHATKRGVYMIQCYDPQMSQGGCGILDRLYVWRSPFRPSFLLRILRCWLHFRLHPCLSGVLLLSRSRMVVYWWCAASLPDGFTNGRAHDFVKSVVLSQNRPEKPALCADRLYAAPPVIWAVASAERGSLAGVVACIDWSCRVAPEVAYSPPASSSDPDVYDNGLDAEGEGDLSDLKPSGEIDVHLILQDECTVIHNDFSRVLSWSTYHRWWCSQMGSVQLWYSLWATGVIDRGEPVSRHHLAV